MILMDVAQIVRKAVKSGQIGFGYKSTEANIRDGSAHAIVMSKNCPKMNSADIEKHAEIAGIPIAKFDGTSLELGEMCGKPFPASVVAIMDRSVASEFSKEKKK